MTEPRASGPGPEHASVARDLSPVLVAPATMRRRPATPPAVWLAGTLMVVGSALMIAERLLLGALMLAGACLLVLVIQARSGD